MKQETEFGYKTRQALNDGLDRIDSKIAARLYQARQAALGVQRQPVGILRLAGVDLGMDFGLGRNFRTMLAICALTIGATGTYYWNAFNQAQEYEEIDSALLADELPPSAYLDKGFHVWLEHGSDSSSE